MPEPNATSSEFPVLPPLVRTVDNDAPANQVLTRALQKADLPVRSRQSQSPPNEDYAQIDPALTIAAPNADASVPPPHPSLSYAGYTPPQRYWLLQWLHQPTAPAPPAFQQLYLAHLETRLFEGKRAANQARRALLTLHEAPAWSQNAMLQRAILLSFWLQQDGAGLSKWLTTNAVRDDLLGVGLGLTALLDQPLSVELFAALLQRWTDAPATPDSDMLSLQLTSLQTNLGRDPLAHALAQLPPDATDFAPWRCAHRDLRIAVPQPDLHPVLQLLVNEVATVISAEAETAASAHTADDAETDRTWTLVLEFGHSRSEYFDFTLARARQRPGYAQLMDENRNLVYRVVFRKREMRHFWQLWEYVQNWSTTRVYLNGEELEKWKVWPYSQYMR